MRSFHLLSLMRHLSTHGSCSAAGSFLFIMKPYAEKFYSSKAWKNTRAAYAKSKRNLCELCLDKGLYKPCEIVHHKVELTPDNIDNPDITLNWQNLQCVCRDCHAMIHDRRNLRYKIDEFGRVTPI